MSKRHWLQLALTDGIGPILSRRLVDAAGSAEAACAANVSLLRSIEGIATKAQSIFESLGRAKEEVDAELARCESANVRLISLDDPEYPVMLKVIPDPPGVLYVRGSIEPRDLNSVGVVGSRRCSHYGREQAERFGALLAGAGVTVISGGARGVDSAAHRGALSPANGRTIAVLGCGVDIAYPSENEGLFAQIARRGAVISEFPMSSPPTREHFPRRNRIISGLSRGILVIEADVASGALITARQACDDHGRPVFALPGRVDNPMSAGPHQLIRDGATLTADLADILDGLGSLPHQAVTSEPLVTESAEPVLFQHAQENYPPSNASERQHRILAGIDLDPTALDSIIVRCELPAEVVMQELTLMSLRGMVKRVDGQHYVRRN